MKHRLMKYEYSLGIVYFGFDVFIHEYSECILIKYLVSITKEWLNFVFIVIDFKRTAYFWNPKNETHASVKT